MGEISTILFDGNEIIAKPEKITWQLIFSISFFACNFTEIH